MSKLILLRGLPGSGKSTFASSLFHFIHIEADMYFDLYNNGKFDASKLKDAHNWCQSETFKMLNNGCAVVVSNTFTQEWEMKPYLDFAKEHGIETTVLIVENRHGNSSVHNVPEETISKMRNRFEVKL